MSRRHLPDPRLFPRVPARPPISGPGRALTVPPRGRREPKPQPEIGGRPDLIRCRRRPVAAGLTPRPWRDGPGPVTRPPTTHPPPLLGSPFSPLPHPPPRLGDCATLDHGRRAACDRARAPARPARGPPGHPAHVPRLPPGDR